MRGIHSYATVDYNYPRGDGGSGSPVWYGILGKELRRGVRDVTFMSDDSPTLAHVFALSEKIKFNMVEERVVTSGFSRDTTITSHG